MAEEMQLSRFNVEFNEIDNAFQTTLRSLLIKLRG